MFQIQHRKLVEQLGNHMLQEQELFDKQRRGGDDGGDAK